MTELFDCRRAFSQTLIELAEADERVVVVVNDSIGSSSLTEFVKRFPDRTFNVGIAEQDLVGISAGLASGGCLPFACAASPFLTGRALEQIKVDVAYSFNNVKLVGMSSGLAYGQLGPTHHSIEDFAWTRVLPNLAVVAPADPIETTQAVKAAAAHEGPVFLRLSRMPVPVIHPADYQFRIGTAALLRPGSDLTLIANGVLVWRALEAAELLAGDGVSARVLNMATVSPIDANAIEDAARETGRIVTIEEHSTTGGLGSAVAEVVVRTHPVPVRMLGVPGVFAPTGSAEFLLERFGMQPAAIRDAALKLLAHSSMSGLVPERA
jgi:transketolase